LLTDLQVWIKIAFEYIVD